MIGSAKESGSMTATATFDRTLEQRMTALQQANEIRFARAALRVDLYHGNVDARDIILSPPKFVQSMRVVDLLLAVPRVGPSKAARMLRFCRVSATRPLGGMTQRERVELSSLLRFRGVR